MAVEKKFERMCLFFVELARIACWRLVLGCKITVNELVVARLTIAINFWLNVKKARNKNIVYVKKNPNQYSVGSCSKFH